MAEQSGGWIKRLLIAMFGAPPGEPPQMGDGPMKIVVGLGNLEPKYVGTRHNIGFEVLNAMVAGVQGQGFTNTPKLQSVTATISLARGPKLLLAKPTTLMNRSGHAVAKLVEFYKVDPAEDVLVVCDDFTIDLGELRLRPKGSHGGQNGLRDIIRALGGDQTFPRLRCGIGPVPPKTAPAHFVLTRFKASERKAVDDQVERAEMAVRTWAEEGVEAAQSRFNGAAV